MAVVGVKLVTLGLVDDNQKLIVGDDGLSENGLYQITSADLGTKSANITGLSGTNTIIYGNNVPQDVSRGSASPSVALDINNLAFAIKQKVKGFVSDNAGGWTDQQLQAHVAMLVQSQSIDRKNNVYFGFGNGLVSETEVNLQTDTTTQTRVDDALTYTALDTIAFGNVPYKIYTDYETNFNEATMLSEVFGGYTAGQQTGAGSGATTPASSGATTDPGSAAS
ncbi:phage tail protein [Lacticaseibacillus pantheris]|uniref:phage tail protein n=1 Tax=Lacticaseibacillus pantheris TaxID=171523 RepID=UPI002659A5CB|nr:phage tail protein [Lacticaseibacillus pantheris]WKF86024.1 phage tail protein [Lacticaseibacillus pantheris]